MSRKDKATYVRLPETLKAQLEAAAQKNCRSVSGEIVHRLKLSFADTKKPPLGGSSGE